MISELLAVALAQSAPTDDSAGYKAWYECTVVERASLVNSTEPIEVLAIAVLSACSSFERAAHAKAMARAPTTRDAIATRQIVNQLIAEIKEDMRGTIIEYFVRKRLPPS